MLHDKSFRKQSQNTKENLAEIQLGQKLGEILWKED